MPGTVEELSELRGRLEVDRQRGRRIVLTNGIFDLLHVGHLRFLRAARQLGDVLVVGVNADSAVLKPGRPLVPDVERAELVAALEPVDHVVVFAEPTADALLRAVHPDIYAKGADYTPATLPEAATAEAIGASVAFIPLVTGYSTTTLVAKLEPRTAPVADRPKRT
ncbi:MAG TPA: adenylyltransferase/cytidyltransferase family protein [Chloroflexota bacterium]|jgi:D-beta-D-heptose 7-phosphate kinase/D-beta-D-heptose 1-phosphate adenosyltransferase